MKRLMSLLFTTMILSVICTSCWIEEDTASLQIRITDAPFPSDFVSEANITIVRMDIKKDGSDDYENLSKEKYQINLLDYKNGESFLILDKDIEISTYDELLLRILKASIVLKNGTVYDLEVSSGEYLEFEIPLNPVVVVEDLGINELVIDFDVSRSFIAQGDLSTPEGISGFTFDPTVRILPQSNTGRFYGHVLDPDLNEVEGAQVTIYSAGNIIASSLTDETGYCQIGGLVEGIYTATAEYKDYPPVSYDNIEITAEWGTTQGFILEDE